MKSFTMLLDFSQKNIAEKFSKFEKGMKELGIEITPNIGYEYDDTNEELVQKIKELFDESFGDD